MARNSKGELVDFGWRKCPPMPEGYIAVLIDDEWVVRRATPLEVKEMEEISLQQVSVMISQLTVIYPTKLSNLSDNQIAGMAAAWYEKLKGEDSKVVRQAFNDCTSVMSQPPVIADIIKAIKRIKVGA